MTTLAATCTVGSLIRSIFNPALLCIEFRGTGKHSNESTARDQGNGKLSGKRDDGRLGRLHLLLGSFALIMLLRIDMTNPKPKEQLQKRGRRFSSRIYFDCESVCALRCNRR